MSTDRKSGSRLLQGQVSGLLAQGTLAALLARPKPYGLWDIVHSGEEGVPQILAVGGRAQEEVDGGIGLNHARQGVCLHRLHHQEVSDHGEGQGRLY